MEFLKSLFTEPLSFEAFAKAAEEKGIKLADLSGGKYVERDKYDKLGSDLKTAKETIETMTGELQTLKDSNATAEDWKKRFEDLQKDNAEKERLANEAKAKAEKEAAILARYEAASIGRDGKALEWAHDAIKADYLKKFTEAIESADNEGKSDADIFHSLTKDDAGAFKGITAQVNLAGGSPIGGAPAIDKAHFAKMGYESRVRLYNENKDLYERLKED